jgi:hypothetical protein
MHIQRSTSQPKLNPRMIRNGQMRYKIGLEIYFSIVKLDACICKMILSVRSVFESDSCPNLAFVYKSNKVKVICLPNQVGLIQIKQVGQGTNSPLDKSQPLTYL